MRTDQFSGLHDMSASAGGVGQTPFLEADHPREQNDWQQTPLKTLPSLAVGRNTDLMVYQA